MSTTKHRLYVLDVEMCDRQLGRESRSAHDFLDNLEMDTLAARAFQVVPTLEVVELAINSAKARVTHWKNEGGTFTHIESEDQAEAIIDSIVSPLLRGTPQTIRVSCMLIDYRIAAYHDSRPP